MMKDRIDICEKHLIIREALKKFACEVLGRAPKTAKDYTESMERYLPRFMESNMGVVISSIYDILDLNQLQNIYDRIRNNREWMSYNTHAHASTFTSGLKCYMQFIQSDYYAHFILKQEFCLHASNRVYVYIWMNNRIVNILHS